MKFFGKGNNCSTDYAQFRLCFDTAIFCSYSHYLLMYDRLERVHLSHTVDFLNPCSRVWFSSLISASTLTAKLVPYITLSLQKFND
jgi:hypothetical protein